MWRYAACRWAGFKAELLEKVLRARNARLIIRSGRCIIGHIRNYSIGDALAR